MSIQKAQVAENQITIVSHGKPLKVLTRKEKERFENSIKVIEDTLKAQDKGALSIVEQIGLILQEGWHESRGFKSINQFCIEQFGFSAGTISETIKIAKRFVKDGKMDSRLNGFSYRAIRFLSDFDDEAINNALASKATPLLANMSTREIVDLMSPRVDFEEVKAEDQKAEDQKAEDQKAEDQKAEDQKAEDQKPEEQKPEGVLVPATEFSGISNNANSRSRLLHDIDVMVETAFNHNSNQKIKVTVKIEAM